MEIAAAPEAGSDLNGNCSLQGSSGHNITRIDREIYLAAMKGKSNRLISVENMENLLTPNKNTVLHIHLTCQTTENVPQHFVEQVLDKCEGLVLLPNAKGETTLHMATRYGHCGITKLLIERAGALPQDIENGIGADKKLRFIRASNCDGDTALHEAVRYGHIEVVEMLLQGNLDPDRSYFADKASETPLYMASERQQKCMVRKMLELFKYPAYDGHNGRTALHTAVIK